jgi:hypothetical protein
MPASDNSRMTKTDMTAKIAELRKMTIRVFFDDSQMKKERYAV